MVKMHKTWSEIQLKSGKSFVTEVKESEYSWKNGIEISTEETLTDFPISIRMSDDDGNNLIVKPSDILYIVNHKTVVEVESDDEEDDI